ncbi:hypothetical protein L1049_028550 [Liquidambar formosana]|uniref:Disease resistance protein RGA3 n=1 Tax=Liquidambar formosana TaxID=63359 RepID=A0AAP0RKS7_LIQFO
MAGALVSKIVDQLVSLASQKIEQEVSLVTGVETEVEKLTHALQSIQAVLVDAERRQVREESVKVWLGRLKDLSYDMDDVLDEWSTALLKLRIDGVEKNKMVCRDIPSPSYCFTRVVSRRDIGLKIKELKERLDSIASEQRAFNFKTIAGSEDLERHRSTSFVDVSEVHGRDQDKNTIVSKLLCDGCKKERGSHIISIVGMGGIGKTTLTQLAYNDVDVKAHFDRRIWVCVSDPFDEIGIAKKIAKELGGSDPSSLDWEDLPQRINESVAGKKFLLVLDDVWPHDYRKWEPLEQSLRSGSQGSRILVTTRDTRVAKKMGATYIHPLVGLSKEVCWSMFSRMAFFGRSVDNCEELEEIGREIANKCKGLPLAAKTLGGLMRFKETKQEWRNVLDSKMWELEDVEKGLFAPILLSYYDLPPALKRCFSYCAIFPKDRCIETEELIQLWMAQGYLSSRRSIEMEMIGREYFDNLAMRSFFQDFEKNEDDGTIEFCKMHDIVHDFAQFLTEDECFIMEACGKEVRVNSSYPKFRHSSIVLTVGAPFPDSILISEYLHTLLALPGFHFANAPPEVFRRLKYLRALDLRGTLIRELPRDVGTLIHLRYLNLSCNLFENLPERVCDLCNLQTLDLRRCRYLKELPEGMGKLINLRYLNLSFNCFENLSESVYNLCNLQTLDLRRCQYLKELPKGIGKLINLRNLNLLRTDQLVFLPKGFARLSSLQILPIFIVSGDDERQACKFGDLRNLNNLRSLGITRLGNLGDVGEAQKLELKRMKHLVSLHFDFFSRDNEVGKREDVIEALEPHPNLKDLCIHGYGGTQLPGWMMSLTKLRKLSLSHCYPMVCLPPLGKLPFLERLCIQRMENVEKVGVEFLGLGNNENDGTADKDEGTTASVIIAFPKLKHLSFYNMWA